MMSPQTDTKKAKLADLLIPSIKKTVSDKLEAYIKCDLLMSMKAVGVFEEIIEGAVSVALQTVCSSMKIESNEDEKAITIIITLTKR